MNEKFLREIGPEPAQSTSRNLLESPPALSDSVGWALGKEDFVRRIRRSELIPTYEQAREEAVRVEKEIDERVKGLYGL